MIHVRLDRASGGVPNEFGIRYSVVDIVNWLIDNDIEYKPWAYGIIFYKEVDAIFFKMVWG